MESKDIKVVAITALVTMLVTGVVGWLVATSQAGMDAAEKARIEAIIQENQVTDQGTTYAQELVKVNTQLTTINVQIGHLTDAVKALAESQDEEGN